MGCVGGRQYPDLADVKVFTIGTGAAAQTSGILRDISCGSGGQFQVVSNTQNLYRQMSMYATPVSRVKLR